MDVQQIAWLVLRLLMLIPIITLHEAARAWAADRLGDATAREQGRVTLHPMAHIDVMGTLVFPGLLLLTTGGRYVFGWGRQVPVDPSRLRDRRWGMLGVIAAGLGANLALSILLLLAAFLGAVLQASWTPLAVEFAGVSTLLVLWNLLPIPPMDGWRALQSALGLREPSGEGAWLGPLILLAAINFTSLPALLWVCATFVNYEILAVMDWIRGWFVLG